MALEIIHNEVKERMREMFISTDREDYANGFDLRHYHQDVLKKRLLDSFRIHSHTEDEYFEKIQNNAWVYNYIVQRSFTGSLDVPTLFQTYCSTYAAEMYDAWYKAFLNDTYELEV